MVIFYNSLQLFNLAIRPFCPQPLSISDPPSLTHSLSFTSGCHIITIQQYVPRIFKVLQTPGSTCFAVGKLLHYACNILHLQNRKYCEKARLCWSSKNSPTINLARWHIKCPLSVCVCVCVCVCQAVRLSVFNPLIDTNSCVCAYFQPQPLNRFM